MAKASLGSTSTPAAHAQQVNFPCTGEVVNWKVEMTGTYQIVAFGAQGGNVTADDGSIGAGGLGAEIGGDFVLTEGEVLQIAVGGAGKDQGGGGGGSFVVGPNDTKLVIASGGGGGGFQPLSGKVLTGGDGLLGQDGGSGGNGGGAGGTCGNGGFAGGGAGAGGGGGLLSHGGTCPEGGTGGGKFPNLHPGIVDGGFGGGGGAVGASAGPGASGGGGGFSGGGGGVRSSGEHGIGGGGGSFFNFDLGKNKFMVSHARTGDGEVVITW